MKHVVVLVLGDLGRSPRMQYHGYSFAQLTKGESNQYTVSLVGYEGESCTSLITESKNVKVIRVKLCEIPSLRFIALLHALCKGVCLLWTLLWLLVSLPQYDLIVIQNPPCTPALIAAILVSCCNGSRIMLDWHNLGFAMFQERLGQAHVVVRLARLLECTLAKFATYHICVSAAMQSWLYTHFGVKATVLYDRPPQIFKDSTLSAAERHQLLLKLGYSPAQLFENNSMIDSNGECTIQTECKVFGNGHDVQLMAESNRVGLVVSCTSWTPDEDFNLLLGALLLLEKRLAQREGSPISAAGTKGFRRLLVVVTGKGPLKADFERAVGEHCAAGRLGRYVAVRTAWLAPGDYPQLVRCADLGVCLHTSTSGLDLPMKVLDMFGSAVPVCAYSFPALAELVQHGVNGLAFSNATELSEQMWRLLCVPSGDSGLQELATLRSGAARIDSWEVNWNRTMQPLLVHE